MSKPSNIIFIHSKPVLNNLIIREKEEKLTNIKVSTSNNFFQDDEVNKHSQINKSSSIDNLIDLKFSLSRKDSNVRIKSNKIIMNSENNILSNFYIRDMTEFYRNINSNERVNFLNKEYFPYTFEYLKQPILTGKTLFSKIVSLSKLNKMIFKKENINNSTRLSFINENMKKLIKYYLTLVKELFYFEITSSSKIVLIGIINNKNNQIQIYVCHSMIDFIVNHIQYMKFILGKSISDRIITLISEIGEDKNNLNIGTYYKYNKEYAEMNKSLIAIIDFDRQRSKFKTKYFKYDSTIQTQSSPLQVSFQLDKQESIYFSFKEILKKTFQNKQENESYNMSIKLMLSNAFQYQTYNSESNQIEFNINNSLISLEYLNETSYELCFREPFSCLSAFCICIIRLNKLSIN